jgi:hypothetical protein
MPDVHEEVAQFLGGKLLQTFRGERGSVPDWVWVSVLAHASVDRLVACAAEGGPSLGAENRCIWDRTLSYLARVLLDQAERTGIPVWLLQHDIVLPIELRLGARPLAPPSLVRMVLSGLQQRDASDSDHRAPSTAHPAPTTERSA